MDLHSHILPGIDDGPLHLSGFTDMVKEAVRGGITHLFATPHHLNGKYENTKADILDRVGEMNNYLLQNNIPLTLHAGQELRIHRELFNSLTRNLILTLDNKGSHLLLELPSGDIPKYTHDVIYELLIKGIQPIIVHPERNRGFIESPNQLFELVQEGALTQITSGSILGHFGKKIKSFSERIIEHQLAHFVASDAHNTNTRGFTLQEAYEAITNEYGIDRTYYFKENAELLLLGQNPQIEKPIPIRRKILGIF